MSKKHSVYFLAPLLVAASHPGNAEVGVNQFGDASYSMPIELPAASVTDIQPDLSLHYNGTMKNGVLGVAWEIRGLEESIEPCAKNLSQNGTIRAVKYDREDQYCLNGERLILLTGEHGSDGAEYALESDKFSKVVISAGAEGQPSQFVLTTKDGVVRSYGSTWESRIKIKDTQDIRKWNLAKVEKDGAEYTLTYDVDQSTGSYTLSEVTYPNEAGRVVRFAFRYQNRDDTVDRFAKGKKYSDRVKRIQEFAVHEDGPKVLEYRFEYEKTWVSELSRLTKITQCDKGNCSSPFDVNWSSSEMDFEEKGKSFPVAYRNSESQYSSCTGESVIEKRMHDFNGDGLMDYIYIAPPEGFSGKSVVLYNQGDNLDAKVILQESGGSWREEVWPSAILDKPGRTSFVDINGDGRTDMLRYLEVGRSGNAPKDLEVEVSTGSGFVKSVWATEVPTTETVFNGNSITKTPNKLEYQYLDVDGDKLPDLIALVTFSHQVYINGSRRYVSRTDIYVRKNLGDSFGDRSKWGSDIESFTKLADFNGDGLLDVLAGNYVFYGNYDGSLNKVQMAVTPGSPVLVDVNGDSFLDLATGGNYFKSYLSLNKREGFDSDFQVYEHAPYISFPDKEEFYAQSVDFNLDGSTDYIRKHQQNYQGKTDLFFNLVGSKGDNYRISGGVEFYRRGSARFSTYSESIDINGDGRADHIAMQSWACYKPHWFTHQNSSYNDTGTAIIAYNKTIPLNHLKSIEKSGKVLLEYEFESIASPGINTPSSDAQFPIRDVKSGKMVVSQVSYVNENDETQTISFTYSGMKEDLHGRGNLGFAEITSLNTASDKKETTRYAQSFPLLGKMVSKDVVKASEDFLVEKQEMEYEVVGDASTEPVFAYVKSKTVNTYSLLDGGVLNTSVTENTIDGAGNVSEVEDDIAAPVNNEACPRPTSV